MRYRFPAIAEVDEPEIGRKAGEALLPEAGKDIHWLLNKKKSYENDPMEGRFEGLGGIVPAEPDSKEGNMVKREWWKRFTLDLEMQKPGFWPVKGAVVGLFIQRYGRHRPGCRSCLGKMWRKLLPH